MIRNHKFLIIIAVLHVISLFASVIGFIAISAFALSFYDNCDLTLATEDRLCFVKKPKTLYWTMLGFGIGTTILNAIFLCLLLAYLKTLFAKET